MFLEKCGGGVRVLRTLEGLPVDQWTSEELEELAIPEYDPSYRLPACELDTPTTDWTR